MVGGALPPAFPAVRGHRHAAIVLGTDQELLDATLPFLDAGLSAGDLVALSCPPDRTELLRRELGAGAARLVEEPRTSVLDVRAPELLAAMRSLLARAAAGGSGRLRYVGEPTFGPVPATWRERQRYESAVNVLLADAPVDALCLYDRRVLPPQVADSAFHTHPAVVVDGAHRENPSFQEPASYLTHLPLPREPLEDTPPVFAVDGADSLAPLRHQFAAVLAVCVPDKDLAEDLHLAVSEIAANAFRHGVPPVSARIWADDERVVCTITDRGTGYDDPLAGFQPAHGPDLTRGGMGLWLARKLWDHVDLLPGPAGFTVRLSCALRAGV